VYRTYIVERPSAQDRRYIEWAIAQARRRSRTADTTIFDFLHRMLLAEAPAEAAPELKERIRAFAMKVQQFTSPVTAKGIEDTAFYRYNRLASLNDVGGDPAQFGVTVSAYHGASAERAAHRPHTMLATSTHDNKRSEDVRARIDVISESPAEWRKLLRRWERMNRSKKVSVNGRPAPSSNDEYLLYQVLLGSFAGDETDAHAMQAYSERIEAYMLKAVREAKVHTSWINPDDDYENAVKAFIQALLATSGRNLFAKDLRTHAATFAWFGMLNSLTTTLLKLTSPGVPDIYQGNETYDLSLVDPDNRRPVDYSTRRQRLARLDAGEAAADLDDEKLLVTSRALRLRRDHPEWFTGEHATYAAVPASSAHALALGRGDASGLQVVAVVTRLGERLRADGGWAAATLDLPEGRWLDLLTGREITPGAEGVVALTDVLETLPVALLVRHGSLERS
jgi:(1->4)-alpha-D-glucan 1-alpha-D-glucosylmutase